MGFFGRLFGRKAAGAQVHVFTSQSRLIPESTARALAAEVIGKKGSPPKASSIFVYVMAEWPEDFDGGGPGQERLLADAVGRVRAAGRYPSGNVVTIHTMGRMSKPVANAPFCILHMFGGVKIDRVR